MKLNELFYSNSEYLFLPIKANPKVALAVDTKEIADNSFKLYNPFSLKARVLKRFVGKSYFLLKRFGFIEKKLKTPFIGYLENIFEKKLIVSIYFSTDRDKIVLQVQDEKAKIFGYVKIAINEIAKRRLAREKKGIELLQKKQIEVPNILFWGNYMDFQFLGLKQLKGKPKHLSEKEIWAILNILRKEKKFIPSKHPRILNLISFFDKCELSKFSSLLKKIAEGIKVPLYEVYEHGDFAPWNIMKFKNKIALFDLEYFEEKGMEYMDFIKYYFQVFSLLKKKKGKSLLKAVEKKLPISFSKELFAIFLLKELAIKIQENRDYKFEQDLLNLLKTEL